MPNGDHATIDFETRSRASLKQVGPFRYAQDESTEFLCLRYRLPGDPTLHVWHPWLSSEPQNLFDWVASGGIVEAHNAEFEYAVWNYVGRDRMGWPNLSVSQVRCSMSRALALQLPRGLEELGRALKLDVQKDKVGHRLMQRMSKPRKPSKADPSEWVEGFDELERLIEYCGTDVVTEEHASRKMVPLIPRELAGYHLTLRMNERGIYCDVPLCKTAVQFALRYARELQDELSDVTDGAVRTAKQTVKIRKFLATENVDIPNLQAPTVVEFLADKTLSPTARRVLEIRQALAQSSITKYQRMIACAGPDQRIRGTLLFHGASTGRYSGKLIQPQNFIKPKWGDDPALVFELLQDGDYEFFKTIFPDVFRALAAGLRGMLRASPGKILYSGDFNAIEARVILWLADDTDNLNEYYSGVDPYKTMAALIFGVRYEAVTKEQRELGKRVVLGCGFGMGEDKFHATCATHGLPIPKKLARKAVNAYRAKYHEVRNFWYALERTAINAVKMPGTVQKIGKLQWLYRGGYLLCRLPAGRCIAYSTPTIEKVWFKYKVREEVKVGDKIKVRVRIEKKQKEQIRFWAPHSKTGRWSPERTYGGKLAENVTQAVARDVMLESMFRAEKDGYEMLFSVHDELVAEKDDGTGSVAAFENIMSVIPKWGEGLPIKVEGWRDYRYKK